MTKGDSMLDVQALREQFPSVNRVRATCPDCGGPMKLLQGRHGRFLGCGNYPKCSGVREASAEDERVAIYLDGPGGTQVPQCVLDTMIRYLTTCNANHGGVFTTSRESDAILHEAHQAAADLLNAPSPDEIVFGANMTTLTFHLSRAFGRTLQPG